MPYDKYKASTSGKCLTLKEWNWIIQHSPALEPNRHPGLDDSGHAIGPMNGSSGALFLMSFAALILSTVYMVWRVYCQKKYFTEDWAKTNKDGLKEWRQEQRNRKYGDDENAFGDQELGQRKMGSQQKQQSMRSSMGRSSKMQSDVASPDQVEFSIQDEENGHGRPAHMQKHNENLGEESYDEEDSSNNSPMPQNQLAKK